MQLLEQLAPEYRTEVRVCPSGKSVGPKFRSSNGVLAHSRIAEGVCVHPGVDRHTLALIGILAVLAIMRPPATRSRRSLVASLTK
jgi:hypothetical protein